MSDETTIGPGRGRVEGKVAIVTGGGTRAGTEVGTGRATALTLAREGAKVLVADLDMANADRTVNDIREAGGEASACEVDVASSEYCAAMVATAVERYGALHVLVNNAGYAHDPSKGGVADLDEEAYRKNLDINLNGAVFSSKYAIPRMVESGGGSIVNVSSIDGIAAGMNRNTPYGITKGALHMLTRNTAAYHGREGIRANCIAPGHLFASMTTSITPLVRDLRRRAGPLGTEGNAWDIAWTALFLASDESRWISGVVIPVDGGLLAAAPLTAYGYIEGVEF